MPICQSCNSEVASGARWCSICHANTVNPGIGRLASPGRRLGATILDLIVPVVVVFLISAVFGSDSDESSSGSLFGLLVLLAYIVWVLVLFSRGQTPGKMLLNMRVTKEDGSRAGCFTMLVREWIGKTISGLIFCLGYLWILFDEENQGWHDKLMNTYVIWKPDAMRQEQTSSTAGMI